MAILIDKSTRILVQGITGKSGELQTAAMIEYGANAVAGVTPGKGGREVCGVPVFNSIREAVDATQPNAAISFVPPAFVMESLFEAADCAIPLLVVTAENIPARDAARMLEYAAAKGVRVLGPGTAGLISPSLSKLGAHPARMFTLGRVGVVSKSGALSYEVGKTLSDNGIGQSTVVALGGGPAWGTTTRDAVELFNNDADTDIIVVLGEIGGDMEQRAADYIRSSVGKPVISLIVGRTAPKGKSLGHAGAIIASGGGAAEKISALEEAGVHIADSPTDIVRIIKKLGDL